MHLLLLPVEILQIIADAVHPSTIVAFGLTCRSVYNCSAEALALHRERQKFRVFHDIYPLSAINALRSIILDPKSAWYFHTFELWGHRKNWREWRMMTLRGHFRFEDEYGIPETEPWADFSHLDGSTFSDRELAIFRRLFRGPPRESRIKAIQQGDDMYLKTALIALAENVHHVTFVWNEVEPDLLLRPLGDIILSHCAIEIAQWPPGLQNLHSIEISTPVKIRSTLGLFHTNFNDLTPLFLLPKLKFLRVNVSYNEWRDVREFRRTVPAGSSSVETLIFDRHFLSPPAIEAMVCCCKALRHLQPPLNANQLGLNCGNLLHKSFERTLGGLPLDYRDQWPYLPHRLPKLRSVHMSWKGGRDGYMEHNLPNLEDCLPQSIDHLGLDLAGCREDLHQECIEHLLQYACARGVVQGGNLRTVELVLPSIYPENHSKFLSKREWLQPALRKYGVMLIQGDSFQLFPQYPVLTEEPTDSVRVDSTEKFRRSFQPVNPEDHNKLLPI